MKSVLVARQDNNGDVLLVGPAVRAIAASARVTFLCGPRGADAARALPGVDEVIVREAEWIDAQPKRVERADTIAFVDDLRARRFDEAIVFTSFHQSPLPLALLLRMAGVARIGAISVDYPGSLLDVRHKVPDDIHEVERALSLAKAMGYDLPENDDGRLAMRGVSDYVDLPFREYVVVHPGATVPARAWFPERNAALVEQLCANGYNVVVTGSRGECDLTKMVAGTRALDLGGATTFAQFAAVVRGASVVVSGNTSAAHVASATGTPVVSIFPPTIPALRFRPWMVPHALLGDQNAPCAGCRARTCPIEGQPCLDVVHVDDVFRAVQSFAPARAVEVA
jgi:ADP-heptose:LPS heptosyltransferase